MSTGDIEFAPRESVELDLREIHEKLKSETPLDLEYHIGNLLSLIKGAIEKLKISIILPKILENPRVLHQYLNNTKYHSCLQLVQEYRNKSRSESCRESHEEEYRSIQIIDYFQENYKILDVLPNWLDDIDDAEKYLLTAFEDVYQIARETFQTPATSILAKEKRLHQVYLANEEVKQNLKDTLHRIENKKLNRVWKQAAKSGVIKKLEDKATFHQYDNSVIIKREVLLSRRQIQQNNNAFAAKQQEFEEELKRSRLDYETKLNNDIKNEKSIRAERSKMQIQLQGLIKNYDQTISDKHAEEIILQKEYEKEKAETDNFLIEYKREEDLYKELVLRKERLHQAEVVLFTYFHAAKKIQKWWKKIKSEKAKKATRKVKAEPDVKKKQSRSKGKKKK